MPFLVGVKKPTNQENRKQKPQKNRTMKKNLLNRLEYLKNIWLGSISVS
jgi:hypothetical protein